MLGKGGFLVPAVLGLVIVFSPGGLWADALEPPPVPEPRPSEACTGDCQPRSKLCSTRIEKDQCPKDSGGLVCWDCEGLGQPDEFCDKASEGPCEEHNDIACAPARSGMCIWIGIIIKWGLPPEIIAQYACSPSTSFAVPPGTPCGYRWRCTKPAP